MDNPDDISNYITHEDLMRRPRKRITPSQRRAWKEATKRWRARHPENVRKWKRDWRMRQRAWKQILAAGVRERDLLPVIQELRLDHMKGHHKYSKMEVNAEAYIEICERQKRDCKGCGKAYGLERAARCTDGSLWGMVCAGCARFVPVYDEIDVSDEIAPRRNLTGREFLEDYLGMGRARVSGHDET